MSNDHACICVTPGLSLPSGPQEHPAKEPCWAGTFQSNWGQGSHPQSLNEHKPREKSRSYRAVSTRNQSGRNPSREIYNLYFPSEAHSRITGKLRCFHNIKTNSPKGWAALKWTSRLWQLPNHPHHIKHLLHFFGSWFLFDLIYIACETHDERMKSLL